MHKSRLLEPSNRLAQDLDSLNVVTIAKPYFAHPLPHLFAHRGLHVREPENTLGAFQAAVEVGATHIETDVHATIDGIAVLHHDGEFECAGDLIKINQTTLTELRSRSIAAGFAIPTLSEALSTFPDAFFNVDIKSDGAIAPTIASVSSATAQNRVLIASFIARRRKAVVEALPGVATSASRHEVVWSWIACTLGLSRFAAYILRSVDAVQVPATVGPLPLVTARYVRSCHRAGVFVDVWTVNDPDEMIRLRELGVDGVVTDRVDIAALLFPDRLS